MTIYVTLGERTVEVEVDGDRLLVDGVPHRAALSEIPGTPLRRLDLDGRSHLLAATPGEPGRWRLLLEGEEVEVEALDERARHIRAMVGGGKANRGGGAIRAPMPGLVVRVLVRPGDLVGPGAGLVVLEAMKMENELKAPGPARVVAVRARPGEAVEKGEVLVELGAPGEGGAT